MRFPLAVLAAATMLGCASTKKEPPPKPLVGTKWQVILELPMASEQPSFRFGDGRIEGFGGCNRVNARYVQDTVGARAIVIGRIDAGMRSSCDPALQDAERRMLDVLQSVSSYTITADTMTMTGSGGTLRFRSVENTTPLAGTRWLGVVAPSTDPGTVPRLEFLPEGRMAGFTGCNVMSGTWTMEGNDALLGPVVTTKRLCLGPEGDLEKRLLVVLVEKSRITRSGARLMLANPGGERFEFSEAPGN